MSIGFFVGIAKGVAKFIDDKGGIVEIAAKKIPGSLRPGQDFNYRASENGNMRIAAPVSARGRPSNSAKDRQQYAMQHLMKKGWTAPQAAGIVGRFIVESYPDLRTTAIGDREIPGGSVGIGQWNRERKAAMIAYATGKSPGGKFGSHPLVLAAAQAGGGGDPTSLDTQLNFFDWEVRNSPSERIAYNAIKRASNPEQAATGMMHYERPRGYVSKAPSRGMHYSQTVNHASRVMGQYDPNYQPKLNFAASQHDLDEAGLSVRDSTGGDATTAEHMQEAGSVGQDDEYDPFAGGEEDTSEESSLKEALGLDQEQAQPYQDLGADNRAYIQQMMAQGQQASQAGPLPGFPTLNEMFGNGGQ